MTLLIEIVVFDGVDELDALGPLEVFRGAAASGGDLSARLVTRTPQEVVTGCHGLRFLPDGTFEPGRADVLLVPGGGWSTRAEAGLWGEVQRGDWLAPIREAAATTRVLAGVCTGALLLAHAGVVGARRVATHRAARADLAATGAVVVPDRVVDDGDLVTSGGVSSGIDLALWLVERECGAELAERVAHHMEYPRVRPVGIPNQESRDDAEPHLHKKETTMISSPTMPAITHVAVTVTDLDVSREWYTRLLGVKPVLDEDTGSFHHVVYQVGDTLFGLHSFPDLADGGSPFHERRVGLDHVAFGCVSRDELVEWAARLDELGLEHGEIVDASYGSGLSFRDPDNIALELFAPPAT
ncbi:MAG: DJ-1/PfpI family protein [Pseudonocardiaceae bacterium]